MATITVLIRHSGKWSEENFYVEYSIDGIVLKEYASYSDLVDLISVQLNVDLTKKCIKIKYTVEVYSDSGETSIEGDVLQLEYNQELIGTNDTLPIVPTFGDQPVDAFDVGNYLIITNRSQKEIMIDQIYMDKSTLKDVMEKYSIEKRFKFLVERSNSIRDDVRLDLGIDINYMLAWRAKEKALESIMGQPAASYGKLPGYLYTLDKTYPGSHIRMKKTPENEFLYVFIVLHAFIKGFDHCRPIVVVDASHLKSTYTGAFVSASTLDGAGNILPLAYGVIDSENDASWTWFFEQFKEAYGERENMCVVSNRHNSIIKAVSIVYNNIQHYACIWHLWANVCKNFRKANEQLSEVFYTMAKAYTQTDFDKLMKRVEQFDVRVKNYLELVGYEKWARLYAPVHRGWVMTSNIAECINSTLVAARELPIFDFLEQVRLMFARWNCTNRKNASCTFTLLGKKFQEMLVLNESKPGRMTVVPSTDYIYSVSDEGESYIVCLEKKTCSCNRFQVDGIPCAHAWRVLNKKHMLPDEYCSDFYKPETILRTYEVPVYPLPDKSEWNIPEHIDTEVVLPPKYKRPPGRPKKQREKSFSEFSKRKGTNSCSTCGQRGHNRRSC
ncbi:hypothetical protein KY289_029187 [Solanum tuberosum]|nr:hypothetical protein KY289_029187 [Solanum tuberosum]